MNKLMQNKYLQIILKNKYIYWITAIIIAIIIPWIIFQANPIEGGINNSRAGTWSRFSSILIICLFSIISKQNKQNKN
ncbi:hypothetical protein K5V21_13705 [Clostridium sardiniense]|uniref:Uncharacterized protein n=1 Tax=Clostridium sardiniense TaxID=29369 RepID=A0ABS7L0B1_CLOSR|nr:hypothetical protein [Clostridium sardiniense]MBY0756501.1 hypothetical protein [Clostridium sardiniense]MDQ0460247.1 hypothetical protein [Clostridium sardiniense]